MQYQHVKNVKNLDQILHYFDNIILNLENVKNLKNVKNVQKLKNV